MLETQRIKHDRITLVRLAEEFARGGLDDQFAVSALVRSRQWDRPPDEAQVVVFADRLGDFFEAVF